MKGVVYDHLLKAYRTLQFFCMTAKWWYLKPFPLLPPEKH